MTDLPRMPKAKCNDEDLSYLDWFPTANGRGGFNRHQRNLVDFCKGREDSQPCPELAACLGYALRVNVSGVWGGTTESQRRDLRRQRDIVPLEVHLHDE